jgi:hypothetical protein
MHPMFAELFMKPAEESESDERRRLRRSRRSRQLRTVYAARRPPAVSRTAPAGRTAA